jgi:hypothetical protein
MNMGKSLIWVAILATAMACRAAPTAAPATAVPSTAQLATVAVPFTAQPGTTAVSTATATATAAATASITAPAVTASQTSSPTTPAAVPTVGAGEVIKLSGDTYATSDPFRFDADATLEITWNYTGTAPFALWLVNASAEVNDPNYDRILITDIKGPHSGTATAGIIAGDWTVQVEQADGPWTVAIKPKT